MSEWSNAPAVLVFGDTDVGIAMASASVLGAGGRLAAALPIGEARQRLDSQIGVELVIVDVSRDHGPLLDELFGMVEEGAAAGRFSSVVVVAPALLDIVAARIGHENVDVLVGRDSEALAMMMQGRLFKEPLELRETNDAAEPRVSGFRDEEDAQIGRVLSSLAAEVASAGSAPPQGVDNDEISGAGAIREMIRARRLRDDLFGAGLFADPAWDILLDLSAAKIEGRSVAVSSLCIAAAVPATTALRWIKQLTEAGLLRRAADPVDGRRVFIELTDAAATAMMSYFAATSGGARG
ncbi:winged helix DNA-binding protein [Rhizorhabdus argentea]|uniref:winged helix DNA-binding protein n=1 Tax=Rhizorhabdus argentea TaxID=1387174 RepID=UPI0030EEA0C9